MNAKQCIQCNKHLQGIQRLYCSNSCGHRYRVPIIIKQKSCELCGKQFKTHNRNRTKRCCSQKCHNEITFAQRQKTQFERSLKRLNIDEETYKSLFEKQNDCCAICRKPETARHQSGKIRQLAVDHCHETGNIRGLLCTKCNTGIGLFKDSWLLLDNAMEYLTYWHSKHGSSKVQSVQESPLLN